MCSKRNGLLHYERHGKNARVHARVCRRCRGAGIIRIESMKKERNNKAEMCARRQAIERSMSDATKCCGANVMSVERWFSNFTYKMLCDTMADYTKAKWNGIHSDAELERLFVAVLLSLLGCCSFVLAVHTRPERNRGRRTTTKNWMKINEKWIQKNQKHMP